MRILTMTALTVAALSCGTATADAQSGPGGHPTVSFSSTGTATAAPDEAILNAAVDVRQPAATDASQAANAAAQKLIDAAHNNGIADEDIQTTGISLNPVTDWNNGSPKITGYEAGESFTIKIHQIDQTGAVIGAITDATGDAGRINGVCFDLADRTALRAKARDTAIAGAQAIAQQYADDTGHRLGGVLSLSENGSSGGFFPGPPPPPMAPSPFPGAVAPPIATGQIQERVEISVEYELD